MTPWEDHQGRRGWTGVLALSVALNGLLLALLGSSRPIESKRAPVLAEAQPEPVTVAPVVPGENTVPTAFKWTELVAEELGEYAENLRALGCPEHVVRGVMADEIRSRYLPLIRQLRRVSVEEHWERDAGVKSANQRERTPETMAAEARLNDLYREYMGRQREFGIRDERSGRDRFPDFDRDDLSLNFLSEEKQARLRQDEEAVDQLRLQLRTEGVPEDEVRQRVAELQAAHARGREEFLEPAENEEYNRRMSPHSGVIGSLIGFEPTPKERAAIMDWRVSAGDATTEGVWEAVLRSLLGEVRYAEMERALDPNYRELYEMTAHFGMDHSVANELYAVQQASATAVAGLRDEEELEPERRLEGLAEVQAESERAVRALLGDEVFGVYARRADWLKALEADRAGP
ncbi:MAG: hypothetical protein KJ072_00860 [Verrucomicrobia bacterium]|nr:hypothetical protein [Verrucomicrobiota bacterium]